MRNGHYIQGMQQVHKLPTPDTAIEIVRKNNNTGLIRGPLIGMSTLSIL